MSQSVQSPSSVERGAAPAECPVRQRDLGLDALKGVLILCVILGHLDAGRLSPAFAAHYTVVQNIIYFFHIPLFLAVSTFFVTELTARFLGRRALTLLVPYAFWFFQPSVFADPVGDLQKIAQNWRACVWGDFEHIRSPLWFLPALFSLVVLCAAFHRFDRAFLAPYIAARPADRGARARARGIAALLVVIALGFGTAYFEEPIALLQRAGSIPFGLAVAAYMLPIALLLGAWNRALTRAPIARLRAALIGIPVAAFATWVLWNYEPIKSHSAYLHRIDLAEFSVAATPLGYISLVALCAALMLVCTRVFACRPLALIGRLSFPIYLLHTYFTWRLAPMLVASTSSLVRVRRHPQLHGILFTALDLAVGVLLPLVFSALFMRFSKKFRWIGMVDPSERPAPRAPAKAP